jgi:hypothetical protein
MEKRLSILDHLIRFSEDENFELKQSSISVITNLVTVSSVFRKYALELNIVQKYSKMLNRSTTESSKPNVAKLLVCLVDCDVGTRYQVFMEAIVPLLQNLVGDMNACVKESGIMDEEIVISTKDNPEKKMAMSPVRKEFDSVVVERVAESPQGPTDTSFPDIASPVTVKPLKELALTWKLSMDALAILFDSDLLSLGTSQENHDYIELFQDYCAYLFSTIMNAFLFAISQKELSDAYGFEVANTATKLLGNLLLLRMLFLM